MTWPASTAEAITALRSAAWFVNDLDSDDYGRSLIHTYRGPFGADWDLDDAIRAVTKAKQVVWTDSWLGHDLVIEESDGKVVRFGVKRPGGSP